jgi:hypothetical protein
VSDTYDTRVSRESWLKPLKRRIPRVHIVLAVLLGVNIVLSGVWDVYAHFWLPPGNSVSFAVWSIVKSFPAAGLAIGALLGHLFWPLTLPKD